ncbi:hypothetical protein H6P81_011794 [Aristolochia fimbriata]|uniref:Uncharacterized protein n=1 Tax=Aristolochia fimbriata TaxID=158543 RepID=A0AAV7ED31_ARIFI|nr:hypothetical protein H6P81_011794 [Aristolochia fimbriata]
MNPEDKGKTRTWTKPQTQNPFRRKERTKIYAEQRKHRRAFKNSTHQKTIKARARPPPPLQNPIISNPATISHRQPNPQPPFDIPTPQPLLRFKIAQPETKSNTQKISHEEDQKRQRCVPLPNRIALRPQARGVKEGRGGRLSFWARSLLQENTAAKQEQVSKGTKIFAEITRGAEWVLHVAIGTGLSCPFVDRDCEGRSLKMSALLSGLGSCWFCYFCVSYRTLRCPWFCLQKKQTMQQRVGQQRLMRTPVTIPSAHEMKRRRRAPNVAIFI